MTAAFSSAEGQSQPPPFAVQVHAGPHAQGPPGTRLAAATAAMGCSSAEGQSQPPPLAVQVHAGPQAQGPPTTFFEAAAATTGSSAAEGQSQPPPLAVQVHAGPQAQGPPRVVSFFTPATPTPAEQVQGPPLAVHAHWGPHLESATGVIRVTRSVAGMRVWFNGWRLGVDGFDHNRIRHVRAAGWSIATSVHPGGQIWRAPLRPHRSGRSVVAKSSAIEVVTSKASRETLTGSCCGWRQTCCFTVSGGYREVKKGSRPCASTMGSATGKGRCESSECRGETESSVASAESKVRR